MSYRFASVVAALVVAASSVALANPTTDSKPAPRVVSQHFDRPPDVVRKHQKFTPEAHPSVSEAHEIAALEQQRWGGPSLANRIECESHWNWAADNGTYNGILQFGPIWYSMWPGTPRDVKLKSHKYDRKKVWLVQRLSNGAKKRIIDHYKRVKVVKIKEGKLPAGSDAFNAWAAIRVGQRAVSGDGPSTAWSCSL